MKKLLLSLIIIVSVGSLCGMESSFAPTSLKSSDGHGKATADMAKTDEQSHSTTISQKKLSPITLWPIYHHFSEVLNCDITPQIFSLLGLELSPITLPQIYHQLSRFLLPKIAQHIFSLQPGSDKIDKDLLWLGKHCTVESLQRHTNRMLKLYGYCYTVERFKRNFLRKGISVCDIKKHDFEHEPTILHINVDTEIAKLFLQVAGNNAWELLTVQTKDSDETALHSATKSDKTEIMKLLLDAAGDKVWTLLTIQDMFGYTALHRATSYFSRIEAVKLLLNAAGNRVQEFMNIRDKNGHTAFGVATPLMQAIMFPYYQKNNQ